MYTLALVAVLGVTVFGICALGMIAVILRDLWKTAGDQSARVACFLLTGLLSAGALVVISGVVTLWSLLLAGGAL
jgi:cbb3-type cytochrome oxidase subunit 3